MTSSPTVAHHMTFLAASTATTLSAASAASTAVGRFFGSSSPSPDAEQAEQATEGFDPGQWVSSLTILGVALVVGIAVRYLGERVLRGRNEIIARLFGRTLLVIALAIGLVYALSTLGIRVGLLLGALGIGGFALAFALRDTLENLISGIILQLRQPFDYADTVRLEDYEGSVDDINLRSVEMTTFGGDRVIIPSSQVLQNPIENWTANPRRRIEIDVGVDYGADIESVRSRIVDELAGVDGVVDEPAPDVVFDGFGGSTIDLTVFVWYDSRGDYFGVQRRAAEAIRRALADLDVDMPYPTREVLLHADDVPADTTEASADDPTGADPTGDDPISSRRNGSDDSAADEPEDGAASDAGDEVAEPVG